MLEKLRQLFAEFLKQEKGNKVTDFNIGGLLSSVAFLMEQEKQAGKPSDDKAQMEVVK